MRRHMITSVALFAAILGLSACAEFQLHRHTVAGEPSPDDYVGLALVVDAEPVDKVRADPQKSRALREKLKKIGIDTEAKRSDIKEWLASIKNGTARATDVPKALTGVGGFPVVQLLEALEASPFEQRIMSGKIRDYVYDDRTKSGHLAVDTKIEIFQTVESYVKGVADRVERYHWDIEVEGAYQVQEHSGNDLDPFPGTVEFTKYTLRGIKSRGLKYKLYAQGEGIRVRHIYQKIDDGVMKRLPNHHPYYESSAASCIDIMFDRYPPESELPPQRGYCLGRCEHPAVVNTM